MLLTEKVHHNRLNNKSMAVVFTKCVICNDAYKIWKQNLSITIVNTKVNCNIASIYGNGATKMS